jgi:nicotinamide riboside transporter PnuC
MAQEMTFTHKVLEWAGTATGLVGAILLALNMPWSGWGFVAFLISNIFWISFAILRGYNGLLLLQIGFTVTSIIGIYRWFFV